MLVSLGGFKWVCVFLAGYVGVFAVAGIFSRVPSSCFMVFEVYFLLV